MAHVGASKFRVDESCSHGSPVWTWKRGSYKYTHLPPNYQKEVLIEAIQVGTSGKHDHDLLAKSLSKLTVISENGMGLKYDIAVITVVEKPYSYTTTYIQLQGFTAVKMLPVSITVLLEVVPDLTARIASMGSDAAVHWLVGMQDSAQQPVYLVHTLASSGGWWLLEMSMQWNATAALRVVQKF
ncbi:hypothetical protein BDR06DRAFT_977336 [Suillus hirtellus]|nr:hypothetical protein BDR06DRAFT_977336 [Suillus hirtellus]